MARPSAARTARRWAPPGRPQPWWSSRHCWTNDGRLRSKPKRLLLRLGRFGAFSSFDVPLQRLHVLANTRCVLRAEYARRETEQASELVIHLIDQTRRSILARRVCVGPGSF